MRVGLDVDEVVAQLHQAWIDAHNRLHGSTYRLSSLPKWEDYGSPTLQALLTSDLYDRVLPYPGTRPAVDSLKRMGHTVIFVSSCGPNNETAFAKQAWLRRWGYLGEAKGLFSGHLIPTMDKRRAPVDVLVDDHLKNVESFLGWSVLQNRIHNASFFTNKTRIDHLTDFVELLWQQRTA